jgi:dephospho-CoA kinase
MHKIGLTGGIGSGKTTVAQFFADLKVPVIDADAVVHELLQNETLIFKKIIAHFGKNFLTSSGELNRVLLRKLIFSDVKAKKWLENLLHPIVYKIMLERANKVKSPYCILVIPLLLETEGFKVVDRVLVVEAAEKSRIDRVVSRDKTTKDQVKNIIASQVDKDARIKKADDVIYNDGTLEELHTKVMELHEKYLRL